MKPAASSASVAHGSPNGALRGVPARGVGAYGAALGEGVAISFADTQRRRGFSLRSIRRAHSAEGGVRPLPKIGHRHAQTHYSSMVAKIDRHRGIVSRDDDHLFDDVFLAVRGTDDAVDGVFARAQGEPVARRAVFGRDGQ